MKRIAECRNYSRDELRCRCGCGLDVTDELAIAMQAFVALLERKLARRVRHIVTSGARCERHNDQVGGESNSKHILGHAVDGVFEQQLDGSTWERIPNSAIAAEARRCGLFGGVGFKLYADQGRDLVHLDVRPGWPAATW